MTRRERPRPPKDARLLAAARAVVERSILGEALPLACETRGRAASLADGMRHVGAALVTVEAQRAKLNGAADEHARHEEMAGMLCAIEDLAVACVLVLASTPAFYEGPPPMPPPRPRCAPRQPLEPA